MDTSLRDTITLPRENPRPPETACGAAPALQPIVRSVELPGHPTSVAQGRRFVGRMLDELQLELGRDDALLMTSELLTNGVQHGDGCVRLVATWLPPFLEVAVTDKGSWIARREAQSGEDTSGRGLQLVERLATRCGSCRSETGTTVWFTLLMYPSGVELRD